MITAVVVNRDPRLAAQHAQALRDAGYVVETCGGPQQEPCPVLGDMPCPIVDRADVLIYDAWVAGGGEGGRRLIADVRDTYPDLPIVLTSVDASLDWVETEGPHRVTPLTGDASPADLRAAVEAALADQGMAV
jgi:DNA-binding NtrC family response regulator